MNEAKPLILLAGATGYVGGRLLDALEDAGHRVRCLARRPENLASRVSPGTEVVRGDLLDSESLRSAMAGVTSAYYLVHSMGSDDSFQEQERASAQNFAQAAVEAGVKRIIYLGGLGSGRKLSPHLASRRDVGRILRESGGPCADSSTCSSAAREFAGADAILNTWQSETSSTSGEWNRSYLTGS